MPNILVIKTPHCSSMCTRECMYERGSCFTVPEKEWKRIKSCLLSPHIYDGSYNYDNNGFYCDGYMIDEYIKDCEIICRNPDKSCLKLLKNIDYFDILDNLHKVVKFYDNSFQDD